MPEQGDIRNPPEPRYEETRDPKNPPNSLVNEKTRDATARGFLGPIFIACAVVAVALLFYVLRDGPVDRPEQIEQDSIGTAGERSRDDDSPGGFNPEPRPDSTREELEFRGADVTNLGALLEGPPQSVTGQRVNVRNIEVETVEGNTLLVRNGDARIEVVAPTDAPAVRSGQEVSFSGTVESDGRGSVRIRASRLSVND